MAIKKQRNLFSLGDSQNLGDCAKDDCCGTADDGSELCVIPSNDKAEAKPTTWQKIRSGVVFSIACIISPCCSIIIVPGIITLLGGTSLGLWMSYHLGWIYGGLTFLSVICFGLGFRWLFNNRNKVEASEDSISTVSVLAK